MHTEAHAQEQELARIEEMILGGGAASPEARAANPQVRELRRRQAAYPQRSRNALAEFFGSRGPKEGQRLQGREIPPEWYE